MFSALAGADWGGEGREGQGERVRGARLVSGAGLNRLLARETGDLTIAGHKFPARLEALHLLITGSTGTGKSVAISELLDGIAGRGDRVFLADAGGNFLRTYYSAARGDVILNPLDARCAAWSPLAEMAGPWDSNSLSKSIVPDGEGSAKEWNGYAQVIVAAILKHVWLTGGNNAEIFRLAVVAQADELREIFSGTPAQPTVAEGNEKTFGSIRGIVGTYLSPFQYLSQTAGCDAFSLKKFVGDDSQKGWIFFNFRDDQLVTISPILAAMADVVSKSILSLDADGERKFWLILDEFASLGRVSSILDFLTKARKNGGRAVVGIQTIAQLRAAYGRDEAQTILSCLSSQLVLRCPDPETADSMSQFLGSEQIIRKVESGGESSQSMQWGKNTSENWQQQVATERIVMPSELQNLPDLRGFLNFAGDMPAAKIELTPRKRSATEKTFIAAPPPAASKLVPAAVPAQQPAEEPGQDVTDVI